MKCILKLGYILYISLLLPTKLRSLNNRVNEFNSLILDMAYKYKYIRVIDNSFLSGRNGCLHEDLGRWDVRANCPNNIDILHLGKLGIRRFGNNIKQSVIKKRNNTSDGRTKVAAQLSHQDRSRSSSSSTT